MMYKNIRQILFHYFYFFEKDYILENYLDEYYCDEDDEGNDIPPTYEDKVWNMVEDHLELKFEPYVNALKTLLKFDKKHNVWYGKYRPYIYNFLAIIALLLRRYSKNDYHRISDYYRICEWGHRDTSYYWDLYYLTFSLKQFRVHIGTDGDILY